MTIESVKDFHQKISEDANFRMSFEAASTREEKKQLIEDAGYDFTSDEWQQVLTEIEAANSSEELSEEELDSVAGGFHATATVSGYGVGAPQFDTTGW